MYVNAEFILHCAFLLWQFQLSFTHIKLKNKKIHKICVSQMVAWKNVHQMHGVAAKKNCSRVYSGHDINIPTACVAYDDIDVRTNKNVQMVHFCLSFGFHHGYF